MLGGPRLASLALLGGCDFGVCPSLSGGLEVGLADVVADGLVDDPQGITQGWWRRWAIRGQEWGQEPVVELGVEDREAPALGGEHVGVAAGQTADEALAAQAGQVVAHLVGRVGGAEQGGDLGAKAPVGEPDHAGEQDRQGAGQGHDPGIAEAQRSGAVSRLARGLCDPRKGWARKDTTRAGPTRSRSSSTAKSAAPPRQAFRPAWSPAGRKACLGGAADLPVEDERDLVGPADPQVVLDQRRKE